MGRAESFLSRWSRRKRLSAARARKAADAPIPATATDAPPVSPERTEAAAAQQLPPIDSLDARSDITRFLAPGVPAELTRQALRRAWTADPAIHEFIGLSENAWDFTAAGGVPGFGLLSAEGAERLLARALGAAGSADAPRPGKAAAAPSGETAGTDRSAGDCQRARQIAGDGAAQQDFDERGINRPPPPHNHGGALPK